MLLITFPLIQGEIGKTGDKGARGDTGDEVSTFLYFLKFVLVKPTEWTLTNWISIQIRAIKVN